MKRFIAFALLLCLVLPLAACGGKGGPVSEELKKWPKNKYTEEIAEPEGGTPYQAIYDEELGYYSILIKDITREEAEAYVEKLKELGFEEMEGADNTATLGVALRKDKVYVNVAESGDNLGIYITFEDKNKADAQRIGLIFIDIGECQQSEFPQG